MKILVIGGGGYVGSLLVQKLLELNFEVKVLDLFIYGEPKVVFGSYNNSNLLHSIKGDMRDIDLVDNILNEVDTVIHLACISNDPSFELNPNLSKSINYDCFYPLVKICKKKIKKFIYASSSSVYGIKKEENVTEDLCLEPLTDYSKFKALCEYIILNESGSKICSTVIRPATVCGYSPRTRLDVIVNILTNHALNNRRIVVHGGQQKRPNIHVSDMVNSYLEILKQPDNLIENEIFNVGCENLELQKIAEIVKKKVGKDIIISNEKSTDLRSYHISSEKIKKRISFTFKKSIGHAVDDLAEAFNLKLLKNSMTDPRYFNIMMMKKIKLK